MEIVLILLLLLLFDALPLFPGNSSLSENLCEQIDAYGLASVRIGNDD